MDLTTAFEKAMTLAQAGDDAAALACLDAVADAIPDEAGLLKFAGQLYQFLRADKKSWPLLQRAVALTPNDAELQKSLGYHFVDNAELELALAAFDRHLALQPGSIDGLTYRGRVLGWLGRWLEAVAPLQDAVARDPSALEPLAQLGRTYTKLGRREEALATFDRLPPDNVLAEIGRRRVRARAGGKPANKTGPAETVVCVKWGTKYGADYVNRLGAMVRRNTKRRVRIVCFTEDARGLDGVEAQPLPAPGLSGWWNKVALFKESLPGVQGRVLYLDLDVVVTGALDPLLERDGDLVIMDNDYVPGFNSSVMLFEVGARPEIWNKLTPADVARLDGDQDWIGLTAPDAELWPDGWCVPFRLRAAQRVPDATKVVVFPGYPNPDEYPAEWVRQLWR